MDQFKDGACSDYLLLEDEHGLLILCSAPPQGLDCQLLPSISELTKAPNAREVLRTPRAILLPH